LCHFVIGGVIFLLIDLHSRFIYFICYKVFLVNHLSFDFICTQIIIFIIWGAVLGFELRASCLLGTT
jgi:ABC-type uncharacterized transport system permease subunit